MEQLSDLAKWAAAHYDEALAVFGAVVLAASGLVQAFGALIALLQRGAEYTTTQIDDHVFLKAANVQAKVSDWLTALSKVLRPVTVRAVSKKTPPAEKGL